MNSNDHNWYLAQAQTHARRAAKLRQHLGVGASDIAQDAEAAWAEAEAEWCRRRAAGEHPKDPAFLTPGVSAYRLDWLEAERRRLHLPKVATVAEIMALS